ncbi:MAG: hypothetical protein ACRDEA_15560, partial [Microcystaceae cyanobacterium]
AGDISITANNVFVDNAFLNSSVGRTRNGTVKSETIGNGGDINIITGSLMVKNGAQLFANTFGQSAQSNQSNAGNVTITATKPVSFENSRVFTSVETGATGNGGNIQITAPSLSLTNGAILSASTLSANTDGKGKAGNINIQDADLVSLSGNSSISTSSLSTQGGDITLDGLDILQVTNSLISASTINGTVGSLRVNAGESVQLKGEGGLAVEATGSGSAGSLTVSVPQLSLQDGASISASTISGQGGDINLENLNTLEVNNSRISASTESGQAGNLTVNARESVRLWDSAATSYPFPYSLIHCHRHYF